MQNIKDFTVFKTEKCLETLCPCYSVDESSEDLPQDYAGCPYYHTHQDKRRVPFMESQKIIKDPSIPLQSAYESKFQFVCL